MTYLKIYIASLMLISLNSSIKDEAFQAFNDLPINDGIEAIIEKSGFNFEYWKTPIPLTSGNLTETWQSQLNKYSYLNRHANRAILQLNREESCYDVSIRIFYEDLESIEKDYEELTSKLIDKGAKIEDISILGLPIKFSHRKIDIDDNQREISFSFSLNDNKTIDGLNLLLKYEVCSK